MGYLLSIDPGMQTGIVLGRYENDTQYERLGRWQVGGGLPGVVHWLEGYSAPSELGPLKLLGWWWFEDSLVIFPGEMTVVCEKFVPLAAPRTFKTAELEPLRIEGGLVVLLDDTEIVWQRASSMVLAGGNTPAQRKKASDDVLRRMGLWSTGKEVGYKDANDVNSAQKHAIAYLRSIGHQPTLDALAQE